MADHADLAHLPKQSAAARRAHSPRAPIQEERCPGAAAQLAAVHRTLRQGPALQLDPGANRPAGANRTGLPDRLKTGVEALSGLSLDDVKVHYNSAKPAQLQALAYTQGSDIHVAPGQARHLPHEAWHVVQQKQGRVKPTLQMKGGVPINDDARLEREADVMGARAAAGALQRREPDVTGALPSALAQRRAVIQRKAIADILNFIDQNRKDLGPVTGIHTKRVMHWNDLGYFEEQGRKLDLKNFRKAMDKKLPIETKDVAKSDLPEFMQVRSDFSTKLPTEVGGEKLWFRKKPENAVMQNRQGWISDNVYWKSAKARYMIHSILGWKSDKKPVDEPEPHITLRNADTQVNIDLDITSPKPKNQERIKGEMEVTRTSFSRGLKGERKPGEMMKADEDSFGFLEGNTIKVWLENVIKAAQTALS